jgi:sugar phosphate isomerase/epimerase
MKLSCSAIVWGKIESSDKFRSILASVREAGYAGVGIEYDLLPESLKKNPQEISSFAEQAGLEVSSMAVNENTPWMAEAAKKMGAESGWLFLLEKDSKAALAITKMHLQAFTDQGLMLGLHPHVRSNAESYEQIDALIRDSRPLSLGVCFDSAHLEALGIKLPEFIEKYRDRMILVHLKDLKNRKPPSEIDFDRDFTDLGAGLVNFKAVMTALKAINYQGWLMVEVDFPHETSVEESIKKNYDYLQSIL